MPSDAKNVSAEIAFHNLNTFLLGAFQNDGIISFNSETLEPFQSLTAPEDSKLLRPLAKLLESKSRDQLLRLAPRSFCNLFVIVLQFPYNRNQERLLLRLLSVTTLYKDEEAAAANVAQFAEDYVDAKSIIQGRQFICRKLAHYAFGILGQSRADWRKKHIAAHLLHRTVTTDTSLAYLFLEDNNSFCMCNTIRSDPNYAIRVLLMDIVRELDKQTPSAINCLLGSCIDQPEVAHLSSTKGDSLWISYCMLFLNRIDADRSTNERDHCVIRLRTLDFEDGSYQDESGNILAIFSEALIFVLPAKENDDLALIEIPFSADMSVEGHTSNRDATVDVVPNLVKIIFNTGNGDRYFQGTRKAINELHAEVANQEDVPKFVHLLNRCSAKPTEHASDGLSPDNLISPVIECRQSLAFLTMDLTSDDNSWSLKSPQDQCMEGTHIVADGFARAANLQGTPLIVDTAIEKENMLAQSILSVSSVAGRNTELYERMRNSQRTKATCQQPSVETPHTSDTDDSTNVSNQTGIESPTLKLSQTAGRAITVNATTHIGVITEMGNTRIGQDSLSVPAAARKLSASTGDSNLTGSTGPRRRCDNEASAEQNDLNTRTLLQNPETGQESIEPTIVPIEVPDTHPSFVESQMPEPKKLRQAQNPSEGTKSRRLSKKTGNSWNLSLRIDTDNENVQSEDKVTKRPKASSVKAARQLADVTTEDPATSNLLKQQASAPGTQPAKKAQAQTRMATSTRGLRIRTKKSIKDTVASQMRTGDVSNANELNTKSTLQNDVAPRAKPVTKNTNTLIVNAARKRSTRQATSPLITRSSSKIQQPQSPPILGMSERLQDSRITSEFDDETENLDVIAHDSYPLDDTHNEARGTIDTSFAAKLNEMVRGIAPNTNQFALPPKTPFGDREKFVANVNAARSVSPQKSAKKNYRKKKSLGNSLAKPFQSSLSRRKRVIENGKMTKEDGDIQTQNQIQNTAEMDKRKQERRHTVAFSPKQETNVLKGLASHQPDTEQLPAERRDKMVVDADTSITGQQFQSPVSEGLQPYLATSYRDQNSPKALENESSSHETWTAGTDYQIIPTSNPRAGTSTIVGTAGQQKRSNPRLLQKAPNADVLLPNIDTSISNKRAQPANDDKSVQAPFQRISTRPNVIHFSKDGPLNQGLQPEQALSEEAMKEFAAKEDGNDVDTPLHAVEDQGNEFQFDEEETEDALVYGHHLMENTPPHPHGEPEDMGQLRQVVVPPSKPPALAIDQRCTVAGEIRVERTEIIPQKIHVDLTQVSDDEPNLSASDDENDNSRPTAGAPSSKMQSQFSSTLKPKVAIHSIVTEIDNPTRTTIHNSILDGIETGKHPPMLSKASDNEMDHSVDNNRRLKRLPRTSIDKCLTVNTTRNISEIQRDLANGLSPRAPEIVQAVQNSPVDKPVIVGNSTLRRSFDAMSMPPPPLPHPPPTALYASTSCTGMHDIVIQQLADISPKRRIEPAADINSSNVPPPKRSKFSTFVVETDQDAPQIGTPATFTTTLCKDLEKFSNEADAMNNSGNQSSDLQDDHKISFADKKHPSKSRSPQKVSRPDTPELTESPTVSEPEFEGTPALVFHDLNEAKLHSNTQFHINIENAITVLKDKIIIRSVEEKNAIQSQLLNYKTHTSTILDRLRDTWHVRIKYEAERLLAKMQNEERQLLVALSDIDSEKDKLPIKELRATAIQNIKDRKTRLLDQLNATEESL